MPRVRCELPGMARRGGVSVSGDSPAATAPQYAADVTHRDDGAWSVPGPRVTQCLACRALVGEGGERHHARTCTAVIESYRTEKENQNHD
jgi:hypothetical protein